MCLDKVMQIIFNPATQHVQHPPWDIQSSEVLVVFAPWFLRSIFFVSSTIENPSGLKQQ